MKTIYLIYLKKSGTLYAYSDIKSIKKRFIRERKKKCFITKKVKMKRSELDEFITKYSKIKLDTLVTRKSNKCYESFVMTTTEKFELIDTAIQLYYKLNAISYDLISRLPIKEKYKKSIKYIQQILETDDLSSTMNLSSIFIDINKTVSRRYKRRRYK